MPTQALADRPVNGLHRARVLIVEDEPLIALDLAFAVEDADGEVVGPARTIRQALQFIRLDGIKGAILDANLPDGDIGPVLEALTGEALAVIVHSGLGLPPDVRERFPQVPVFTKPTSAETLARFLAGRLAAA